MATQRHYHRWPHPCDYTGDDITSYWPSIQYKIWSLPPALNLSFVSPPGTRIRAGTYRGSTLLKHVYPLTWGYYQTHWYPPVSLDVTLDLKFSLIELPVLQLMCAASTILFGRFMSGGGVKLWPNYDDNAAPPYSQNLDMTMQQIAFPGPLTELQLYPVTPDKRWATSFVPLEL